MRAFTSLIHVLELIAPALVWLGGGMLFTKFFVLLWWGLDEAFKALSRRRTEERWPWYLLLVLMTFGLTWLAVGIAETWLVLGLWARAFLAAIVLGFLLGVIALAYMTDPVVSLHAKLPAFLRLSWPFEGRRRTAVAMANTHHYENSALQDGIEFSQDQEVEVVGTDGFTSRILVGGNQRIVRTSSLQ